MSKLSVIHQGKLVGSIFEDANSEITFSMQMMHTSACRLAFPFQIKSTQQKK